MKVATGYGQRFSREALRAFKKISVRCQVRLAGESGSDP